MSPTKAKAESGASSETPEEETPEEEATPEEAESEDDAAKAKAAERLDAAVQELQAATEAAVDAGVDVSQVAAKMFGSVPVVGQLPEK